MQVPHIITISGPSLSGKTEFCKIIKEKYDFNIVTSLTTRAQRSNEINGIDYHFISKEDYHKLTMVQKTNFNEQFYGVSEKEVLSKIDKHLLWVIAPESINQVENYCNEKNWNLTKCFIYNPQRVVFKRILERFKNDKMADLQVYANRLDTMVNQEIKWIENANSSNLYDIVVSKFDHDNTEEVITEVLNKIKQKDQLAIQSNKKRKP